MSGGNGQLRAIIDRILRLKEEQDAIGADIREIYLEAKSSGFDKTQIGNVVAYLRKREKKGADAIAEGESIFDLYLNSYLGTPIARAHTHEADPITGEFTDEPADEPQPHAAQSQASQDVPVSPLTGQGGDESPVTNSNSHAADKTADTSVSAAPASILGMSRAEKILMLRPHCQNPDACRSSGGKDHCFTCRTAMAERERETA